MPLSHKFEGQRKILFSADIMAIGLLSCDGQGDLT